MRDELRGVAVPVPRLRPYQWSPFRVIVDSVERGLGRTIVVIMSRQAGKNELSARLEAYLLLRHITRGGQIVKASPTFRPQTINSVLRLEDRLRDFGLEALGHNEKGYMIRMGRARVIFLGAGPESHIVGATASLLLEVDEAQDVLPEKFDKDLRPMAASTNATTVLYGTPWCDEDLLWRERLLALEREKVDGCRRLFEADWTVVAQANPPYGAYVAGELERLGVEHPLFRTQYLLQLAFVGGGFFSEAQLRQLQGAHVHLTAPVAGDAYVAGLDLGGEADDETAPSRRQDSSALTIGRVDYGRGKVPVVELVDAVTWRGTPHLELADQVADLVGRVWRCRKLVVDGTGLGHTLAHVLAQRLPGRVEPFVFSGASKSQLGFDLLAAASAGAVRVWSDDASEIRREVWHQVTRGKGKLTPGGRMDWRVPEADGHDDLLVSLGLLVRAASLARPTQVVVRSG